MLPFVATRGEGMTEEQNLAAGEWEWEIAIPAGYVTTMGSLAWAILPHLPLLHAWLVLVQLSLPSSRDSSPRR